MKKSFISLAVLALLGGAAVSARTRTLDAAFTYRMGAGFPGEVNRTHPASIVSGLMDPTTPIRLYGDPCVISTANNSYRGLLAADQATVTSIAGILVRPYPVQQTSGGMSSSLGAATPPQERAAVAVLEDGYAMVKCNNTGAGAPTKGGAVYVWCAASAGSDVLGGFRAAASAGNTILLTNAEWASPPDASGIAEIRVWSAKRT